MSHAQGEVDVDSAVVLWVSVHPDHVSALDTWIKTAKDPKTGHVAHTDGLRGKPSLSTSRLKDLVQDLNSQNGGEGAAVKFEQKPGELVHVPPGWAHYVKNLRPCVKFAFDFYNPAHFPVYVRVWKHVVCPFFKGAQGQDYMAVQDVMRQAMQQRMEATSIYIPVNRV
jgi:hypothetical protein